MEYFFTKLFHQIISWNSKLEKLFNYKTRNERMWFLLFKDSKNIKLKNQESFCGFSNSSKKLFTLYFIKLKKSSIFFLNKEKKENFEISSWHIWKVLCLVFFSSLLHEDELFSYWARLLIYLSICLRCSN